MLLQRSGRVAHREDEQARGGLEERGGDEFLDALLALLESSMDFMFLSMVSNRCFKLGDN